MTKIRISGDRKEIDRIYESIKEYLPDILSIDRYDSRSGGEESIYLTLKEPLQSDSENNLQDWMIIEYCKVWRTTPEIKKYFKLEYEATREICDRLFSSGALSRQLMDKSYAYIDRGLVHRCSDCQSFHLITLDDVRAIDGITDPEFSLELLNDQFDGYCMCNVSNSNVFGQKLVDSKKLNECGDFEDIQVRLDVKE